MQNPFDLSVQPVGVASTNEQIAVLLILYLIQVRFLGGRGIFDPTYLRKCSAGSMVEICKRIGRSTEILCRIWKCLTVLLTAIVYLNISGLILGRLLKFEIPDVYLGILITGFLFTNGFSLLGKVVLCVVLVNQRNKYAKVPIGDVFN